MLPKQGVSISKANWALLSNELCSSRSRPQCGWIWGEVSTHLTGSRTSEHTWRCVVASLHYSTVFVLYITPLRYSTGSYSKLLGCCPCDISHYVNLSSHQHVAFISDLSQRVDCVKEENLKLKSENQVLGQYIENLMSASSVFQSTQQQQQPGGRKKWTAERFPWKWAQRSIRKCDSMLEFAAMDKAIDGSAIRHMNSFLVVL